MTQNGGLSLADDDAPWSLQPFLRFSPRRVTLQPGETQVVKIALRPNRDAAQREYYSHLRVVTMEDDLEAAMSGSKAAGKAVTVSARTAIAVPVVWRNSSATPHARIESATFDLKQKAVVVELRRTGTLSTRGYLHLLDSDDGRDSEDLRALADPVPVVIYPSSEQRTVAIPLDAGQRLAVGTEVVYSPDLEMTNRSTRFASYIVGD